MNDGSRVLRADHVGLHLNTTMGVDSITGRSLSHHHVKPSGSTANLPTCFISDNPRRTPYRCLDAIHGRLATASDAEHHLRGTSSRQLDPKHLPQRRHDLSVRQACGFAQPGDRGLKMRFQLHRSRPQGIRRLQGVTPLNARTTCFTHSHGNPELPINRLQRNLDLKLRLDTLSAYATMAVRTTRWQFGLIVLVDARRPAPMTLATIGRSRLASGSTGMGSRRTLREGCRLTFSSTLTGSQRRLQSSDFRPEACNLAILRRVLFFQPTLLGLQRGILALEPANSSRQLRLVNLAASLSYSSATYIRVLGHRPALRNNRGHHVLPSITILCVYYSKFNPYPLNNYIQAS